MAYYRCLLDCLAQKHEYDSLGRYVEIVNLRGKQGKVYDSLYDLTKFNAPGEAPMWEAIQSGQFGAEDLVFPGTDIKAPEKKIDLQGRGPVKPIPIRRGRPKKDDEPTDEE